MKVSRTKTFFDENQGETILVETQSLEVVEVGSVGHLGDEALSAEAIDLLAVRRQRGERPENGVEELTRGLLVYIQLVLQQRVAVSVGLDRVRDEILKLVVGVDEVEAAPDLDPSDRSAVERYTRCATTAARVRP